MTLVSIDSHQRFNRLKDQAFAFRVRAKQQLRPFVIRRELQWILDGGLSALSMILAYMLRFDADVPRELHPQMWACSLAAAILEPLLIAVSHGYRSTWKHFGVRDLFRVALLQAAILLLYLLPVLTHRVHAIPTGVAVIQAILALLLLSGIRMLRRLDHEASVRMVARERVLLVTTAATANAAVRQLQAVYGNRVVGLVINDRAWDKLRINGVPVLGTIDQLALVLAQAEITLLLLCSAELPGMAGIMQTAADLNVAVKLLPSPRDVLGNTVRISRTVHPAAFRKPDDSTATLHTDVLQCLGGRTVLVTGAAGSIGSELVRQVKTTTATRLLLLDQDENGIFELLHQLGPDPRIVPVVADIRDAEAIRLLFHRERPHVVLHAAAYKHVPLMEQNPCEAILNNVIGTRTLAEAAVDFQAERFVMISSDKAVNPSSIMGASKRLAEVVIVDLASRVAHTSSVKFACVRFGNVLGSRGSVLPLFLKQIEQGGPLTVTHEQMTRYFMTIPQAVSLVLRAATLAGTGDIYMLDMGDPVLIVKFARELIQLSGLQPDKDIEVRIVGARPGEKLHEELWSKNAEVSQTTFRHIFKVKQERVHHTFPELVAQLEHQAREHQANAVRATLRELPISYLSEESKALTPLAAA